MGCGHSKFKREESPASLRPVRRRSAAGHRRKGEVRGVRSRRDSIVSTTDLLRSAADDISDVASSVGSPRMSPLPEGEEDAEVEKRVVSVVVEEVGEEEEGGELGFSEGGKRMEMVVVEEVEEEEDLGFGEGGKRMEMVAVEEAEEELGFGEGGKRVEEAEGEEMFPGSPSFRFYFQDSVVDKGVIVEEVLEKLKIEKSQEKEKDDSFVFLNSNEDLAIKSANKNKWKKLRSFKIRCLLSGRGCYHQNHHHPSLARVAPHPSDEKDA